MAISPLDNKAYVAPPRTALDSEKLGWVIEVLSEGEAFLSTQTAWPEIDKAQSIIMGEPELVPKNQSDIQANLQKRIINEVVCNLANMRPIQGFDTQDSEYDKHADILNLLSVNHYHNNSIDRKIKKALQWAAVSTGYICPTWKKSLGRYGQGDIDFEIKGPRDVYVIQPPPDFDLQGAYAVAIKSETPVHLAHNLWGIPEAIQPDRETPTWFRGIVNTLRRFGSPLLNSANKASRPVFQTVDIFHIYIMDTSVNDSGKEVEMGQFTGKGPANLWSYVVPYVGQKLQTGTRTETGRFNLDGSKEYVDDTRPATEEDCLLYPNRRLIIATRHGILYDGPSFWWHGKVPAVKICLDEVPWQYLGLPLSRDGGPVEKALNQLLRGVVDISNVALDPPLAWADGMAAEEDVKRLNLRAPGQRLRTNPQYMDRIFKLLVDPQYYQVNPMTPEIIKRLQELQEYLLDVNNIAALSKARQAPAADTVEAFNNLAGAITTDRSRALESAIEQLGALLGPLFFQFYGAPRRLKMLGPNGLTKEDFDFDPENMVPSRMPNGVEGDRIRRAKWHLHNFCFYIEHGSLHDLTSMTQRMMQLQLKRGGAPISWHTIMVNNNVQNVGSLPNDPVTEIDKWKAEQEMMGEIAANIQAKIQSMMQPGGQQQNDPMGLIAGIASALQGQGANPNGHSGAGRPSSGAAPPHGVTKSDGSQVISESR